MDSPDERVWVFLFLGREIFPPVPRKSVHIPVPRKRNTHTCSWEEDYSHLLLGRGMLTPVHWKKNTHTLAPDFTRNEAVCYTLPWWELVNGRSNLKWLPAIVNITLLWSQFLLRAIRPGAGSTSAVRKQLVSGSAGLPFIDGLTPRIVDSIGRLG